MGAIQPSCFDPRRLMDSASRYSENYRQAKPFHHIVIDSFLPDQVLDQVLEEFPKPSEIRWIQHVHTHSQKLASGDETQLGDFTRYLVSQLNSSNFLVFLEELTGISGLIPDPYLEGGGLHQIERGGFLSIHADFNYYEKLRLDRRVNVLLFLNKDWKEEYGGHLELWNRDVTKCEKRILPVFNRCVIFSTTDFSFHGHPDPAELSEGPDP